MQIGQTGGAGREGGEERGAEPQLNQARAPRQHIFCEHQCVISSRSCPGEFLMHHLFPPHISIQPSGEGDVLLTTGVWKWLKHFFSSNFYFRCFVARWPYSVDRTLKYSYQLTTSGVCKLIFFIPVTWIMQWVTRDAKIERKRTEPTEPIGHLCKTGSKLIAYLCALPTAGKSAFLMSVFLFLPPPPFKPHRNAN